MGEYIKMNYSVAIHNLGCKVNYYEAVKMQDALLLAGFSIVDFEDVADIYIVNTCTVTNIADKKSRQMLSRAKHRNPNAIVVAAGCYANVASDKIKKNLNVDLLVDNRGKDDIVEIIENKLLSCNLPLPSSADIDDIDARYLKNSNEHARAFLKIQDGCNRYCSYCLIPFARGNLYSVPMNDVIDEVKNLVNKGFKEIVLTGIHISSYGNGFENQNTALADIINEIADKTDVKRIRLSSLEQSIISENFLERLVGNDKLMPHFHLSLQSGSNSVLKRMNRRYTCDEYYEKCELLRKYYDKPAITTDIIAGFPMETDEEHKKTLDFIRKIKLFEAHVFPFSIRTGTKAAKMQGQVDALIKKKRCQDITKLTNELRNQYLQSMLNDTADVLVEEAVYIDDRKYFTGHSERYVPIYLEAKSENIDLTNQIIRGKIKGSIRNGLII